MEQLPLANDWESTLAECGLNPYLLEYYPEAENIRDGLSRRDIAFCHMVSRGIDKAEAFRIAYSVKNRNLTELRNLAQGRMKLATISGEMKRMIDGTDIPSPVHDARWLQRTVMQEMLSIVQDKKEETPFRIKAADTLLRHIGITVAEVAKVQKVTSHQPLAEIERIIQQSLENDRLLPAGEDVN